MGCSTLDPTILLDLRIFHPGSLAPARARVQTLTKDDDLTLATWEALTNAMRHGAPPIGLLVARTDTELLVEVSDCGAGFDTDKPLRIVSVDGQTACCCGRFFMAKGCDQVSYRWDGERFVCRMVKRHSSR